MVRGTWPCHLAEPSLHAGSPHGVLAEATMVVAGTIVIMRVMTVACSSFLPCDISGDEGGEAVNVPFDQGDVVDPWNSLGTGNLDDVLLNALYVIRMAGDRSYQVATLSTWTTTTLRREIRPTSSFRRWSLAECAAVPRRRARLRLGWQDCRKCGTAALRDSFLEVDFSETRC